MMATQAKKAKGPKLNSFEALQYQLTICARELRLTPERVSQKARDQIMRKADALLDAWLVMREAK